MKGQTRLSEMGCNAQSISTVPSSSNPRGVTHLPQGPVPFTECRKSPHPKDIRKTQGLLQQTWSCIPQAVVSNFSHPVTSLTQASGCWEGKEAPNSRVSKLSLAPGTCGSSSDVSTRASQAWRRSWLKNSKIATAAGGSEGD